MLVVGGSVIHHGVGGSTCDVCHVVNSMEVGNSTEWHLLEKILTDLLSLEIHTVGERTEMYEIMNAVKNAS